MRYDYEGKAFTAYDPDGRGYLLSPVYRFHQSEGTLRQKTFAARDCVGLLTEDGRWVRRDRPGRYAILGTNVVREVELTSRSEGGVQGGNPDRNCRSDDQPSSDRGDRFGISYLSRTESAF